MTVKEYNEWYNKLNHARNFVGCVDHALQKSDDNARMQFRVIGWSKELEEFLYNAIECYADKIHNQIDTISEVNTDKITRCKDCFFCVGLFSCNKNEQTMWRCQRTGINLLSGEGYCSWARRQSE